MKVKVFDVVGKSFIYLFSTPRLFGYAACFAFVLYCAGYDAEHYVTFFDECMSLGLLLRILVPLALHIGFYTMCYFACKIFFTETALRDSQRLAIPTYDLVKKMFVITAAGIWILVIRAAFEFGKLFFMYKPQGMSENGALFLCIMLFFCMTYFRLLTLFMVPLLCEGMYNPWHLSKKAYELLHAHMAQVFALWLLNYFVYIVGAFIVLFLLAGSMVLCDYIYIPSLICSQTVRMAFLYYAEALFYVISTASVVFLYEGLVKHQEPFLQ